MHAPRREADYSHHVKVINDGGEETCERYKQNEFFANHSVHWKLPSRRNRKNDESFKSISGTCASSAGAEAEEEDDDAAAAEVATVCANDTDFLRRALPPVEPPVEGHDDDEEGGCESEDAEAARELRGAGEA